MRPGPGFLQAGEHRLEYAWYGPAPDEAPTLVFLHEGLGCVAMWKDFPGRVAERTGLGVLVYSRAGYGGSSPVPLPRPLRYMHDEGQQALPLVLEAAGIRQAVVVGHSDGASIAIIHAGAMQHRRIAGLVLMAPHVFNEQLCVDSIRQAREAYLNTSLRERLANYHGDNVDCAFWGWNRAWLDPDFWHWNIERYLPGIRVPALVIQGREDEYGTAGQVEAIQRKSGGPVETLWLDACGHSPHRDRPEATLEAIHQATRAWLHGQDTGLTQAPCTR